ncbi:hypothetical protein SAMN04487771_101947 [[Clostridium] aminophilum]|uniref:Cell wall binding repeat-containing protein n=1 Tax=[Clostridium] aminophilum TaxID=1526 RepID=A0A1I0EMT4_9FIRM|nr:hypothetical protein [[Clostridium] aminophilum]SET46536.1 hypothetical protein SAMN04487771_101947 [[Clostridium] aminophilum]
MKKRILIMTSVLFTAFSSFTAFAGQWKQDAKGWWWDNGDGTYPVSTWQWIDVNNDHVAECYYFNQDGYLLTNTTTPDGYAVNADGQWVYREISDDELREDRGFYANKYDSSYMVKVFIPEDSPLTIEPGIYKSIRNVTYVDSIGPNHIDTDYFDHNFKVTDDGESLQFMIDYDDYGRYWYKGTLLDRNDGYYVATDLDGDGCDDGTIHGVYVISDDVIIVETGVGSDGDYHRFFTMKKVS